MITLDRSDVLKLTHFGQDKSWKRTQFLALLKELTAHHAQNCPEYARILEAVDFRSTSCQALEDVP